MAETVIAAATAADEASAQIFQKELYHAIKHEDFFSEMGLLGKMNSGAPIVINEDFKKAQGDKLNINFSIDLDDDGIVGDGWLEDNEMSMEFDSNHVTLDMYGHAVRSAGIMTEQRFIGNMRDELSYALKDWWRKKKTQWIFKQLYGTSMVGYPGTSRGTKGASGTVVGDTGVANTNIIYGGDATSTGTIDATDVLTPDLLNIARLSAKTGLIGSTEIHKIAPAKTKAGLRYVFLANSFQLYDFKQSQEWKNSSLYAEVRGSENPLFTGEARIWDGILIVEVDIDYLPLVTTWGGGDVSGATGLLLGANAAGIVSGQDGPSWVEDRFNYGRKWGVGTWQLMGCKKLQFAKDTRGGAKIDVGVIAIKTAAKHPKA